ncbi:MAG: hypothetical protein ABSH46_18275 [Bryobacteraceae bacterium]|jgi:hypothetical protein
MPLQFGALKRRPFALYPPILNIEHNEWRVRQTTGPEILVTNLKSDVEVWIPKRLIGDISGADEPLLAVSLLRELEYKAGSLRPYERRVIEMPAPPGSGFAEPPGWTPPKLRGRRLAAALVCALLAALLLVVLAPFAPPRGAEPALGLTASDDYASVVRRLGPAAEVHERPPYRALWYPKRSRYVVLSDGRYIGALDSSWHVIDHVERPGHGDTALVLRSLPRF